MGQVSVGHYLKYWLLRIQRKHFTLQCVLNVAQVDKHNIGSHSGSRIKYTIALAVDREWP